MKEFILFMHGDAAHPEGDNAWEAYLERLHRSGQFDGGSSMGEGKTFRKGDAVGAAATSLVGFLRIRAADAAEAETFLVGNPVFESGGTIEIRELLRD